jgi:prephenate dehydrogenase
MGRCMATLLRSACDLTITSRDSSRANEIADRLGIKGCGAMGLSEMDIVILTIPTEVLLPISRQTSQQMRPGSLLVDVSSVKCGVVDKIGRILPDQIFYISIHPLFSSPRVKIRNTMVIPVRSGPWLPIITDLLTRSGMRVTEVSAEEHDRAMATVQVIHHFALLSMENAMVRQGYAKNEGLEPFLTHNMMKTMNTLKLLNKNMKTIEMIQKINKFSPGARERFIEEAIKLDKRYSKPKE